jgi:hypothetical protein
MVSAGAFAEDIKQEPVSWTDRLTLKGDVRLRFDEVDKAGTATRNRERFRARVELDGKINDDLTAGIALSSGENNSPISGNQTATGEFTTKPINIWKAFLDYKPGELPGLELTGGKIEQPWISVSKLIFDDFVTPEGAAAKYKLSVCDNADIIVEGGEFVLMERSAATDTYMYQGQGAVILRTDKDSKDSLTLGGGVFDYSDINGQQILDWSTSDVTAMKSYGNKTKTISKTGAGGVKTTTAIDYAEGFNVAEGFADLKVDPGIPLEFKGDYVKNNDASSLDTGWLVGAKIFGTKDDKPGSYELSYDYRNVQANAVLAALNDSDSFGGGTDGKGSCIAAAVEVAKNVQAKLSVYVDQVNISTKPIDYERVLADILVKF